MINACRFLSVSLFLSLAVASAQESTRQMQRVDVDGGELAFWEAGNPNGEAVLLIHGGVMADSFLRLMAEPALSNYRLISYHRRGYGESTDFEGLTTLQQQTNDALAVLDQLDVEQAHLVGHSLGGPMVYSLAGVVPERVRSLLLLEGNLLPLVGFVPPDDFVPPEGGPPPPPPAASDPRSEADAFMTQMLGNDWETELAPYYPGVVDQVVSDIVMTFSQDFPGISQPVEAGFYSRIDQPTRYVISEFAPDWTTIPKQLLQLMIPHAEIHYIQGMGHEMQILHPKPMAEMVAEWLAEHPIQ
jgi:pimeloyl-ACP methyl ester carboxylesterase